MHNVGLATELLNGYTHKINIVHKYTNHQRFTVLHKYKVNNDTTVVNIRAVPDLLVQNPAGAKFGQISKC